jgi:hypothetical protein
MALPDPAYQAINRRTEGQATEAIAATAGTEEATEAGRAGRLKAAASPMNRAAPNPAKAVEISANQATLRRVG